jgi:hypothetical protein
MNDMLLRPEIDHEQSISKMPRSQVLEEEHGFVAWCHRYQFKLPALRSTARRGLVVVILLSISIVIIELLACGLAFVFLERIEGQRVLMLYSCMLLPPKGEGRTANDGSRCSRSIMVEKTTPKMTACDRVTSVLVVESTVL